MRKEDEQQSTSAVAGFDRKSIFIYISCIFLALVNHFNYMALSSSFTAFKLPKTQHHSNLAAELFSHGLFSHLMNQR